MVSFFECLSWYVRPQFAKVKEKKRQRHILEVMQEYGFANNNSRKKTWVRTRQLVGKIIKINPSPAIIIRVPIVASRRGYKKYLPGW